MRASLLFVAALLIPGAAGAQIQIRPGQYEFTFDLDLGLPREAAEAVLKEGGARDNKKLECLSDDIRSANDIIALLAKDQDMNCKPSDVRTEGSRLTYTLICEEDGVRMTMQTEMTFGADSFKSVTKGKDPEGRATTGTLTARRVGECAK